VVPVFNSEKLVGRVIDRTMRFFEGQGLAFEIVLVNDGSRDGSWQVIQERALADPRIIAVDLLGNHGQHTALFCGLGMTGGDYAITLDDDLQNPPEEMVHLIEKAKEGHDLVLGRFREKKHPLYRRAGSLLVSALNRRIFNKPSGLVLTNFRLMDRSVVDRVCSYQGIAPYVTGLALRGASNPANVLVEHEERESGRSQYGFVRIAQLMMRVLFAYSSFPLRLVTGIGALVSVLSFLLGCYFLIHSFLVEVSVPGWTTIVVLLSFFNGVNLLILGMLGEYVVRVLNQTSAGSQYEVKRVVRRDA
jgi:polyisoprenyl-phosphate glycosyltransferase